MPDVVSDVELESHFRAGLQGQRPRPHQIDAASCLLEAIGAGEGRRWLVQHAPGSGKTETILLLAFESLRLGLADRVVVLNYAEALEEQFMRRGAAFLHGLAGIHEVPIETLSRGHVDLSERKGGVISCLLQKFRKKWTVDPLKDRTLVICDEAHVGIPEDGTYVKNAETAFGADRLTVLFTATPKAETLTLYGVAAPAPACYMKPFHVYTQRDAIGKNAMLSPLEKYESAVPKVPVDGVRLLDTAMASLSDFLERLHERRNTTAVRSAWAEHILAKLPVIIEDMPNMKQRQKYCVVVETVDEVVAMTTELRKQIKAKALKNACGHPLHVSCFYTGSVPDIGTDFKANGSRSDAEALEQADLIILCRKYTTGWDEWRVCGIFICRRVASPEFLMQLLGRATRVKPGSGKKLPYIVDFANDPTWIFESAARFLEESRLYTSPSGRDDLQEQVSRIRELVGSDVEAQALIAARRLRRADQATLMAAALRHLRLQKECPLLKGYSDGFLRNLLRELNKAMVDSLWGGSLNLAERAVQDAVQHGQSRSDLFPGGGATSRTSTLTSLLRPLRRLLRHEGVRRAVATPARGCKRPRSDTQEDNDAGEQEVEILSPEKRAATMKAVLDNAVRITAERFQVQLKKTEVSSAVCALREKYVNDLRFRVGGFFLPDQADDKAAAEAAIDELQLRVDSAATEYMRVFLLERSEFQFWHFKVVIEAVAKAVPVSGLLVPAMFSKVRDDASALYRPVSQMLGGTPGEKFQSMYEKRLDDYVRRVCKRTSAQSRDARKQMRGVQRFILRDFQQRLTLDPSLASRDKLPTCIEECIAQFVTLTAHLPGATGGIGHGAALKLSWRLSVIARNAGSANKGDDSMSSSSDDAASDSVADFE